MIYIPGPYPPAVYKHGDQLYAFAGSKSVAIPKGTFLKDLYSDFVRTQERLPLVESNAWKVTGSTGNKYIVERDMLGSYSCTCLGFNFKKHCSHIDRIKEKS